MIFRLKHPDQSVPKSPPRRSLCRAIAEEASRIVAGKFFGFIDNTLADAAIRWHMTCAFYRALRSKEHFSWIKQKRN
jgi:hypothetical protein